MKSHTSEFKEEIKTLGKQQSVRITYKENNVTKTLTDEDINSVTPNYEANLLKSVMKALELDSNISIPKDTEIKFEYGLLVNGAYEYLNYGNYIVAKEPEKQEDTLSYKITCYDKMLYSMKDYEHIDIPYPCTIKQYLVALCNKIGLQFKDSNFANANRQITSELFMTINEDGTYSSMGYTYRDVLDQIAETTGGCICITLDDKVEVRYINKAINYETSKKSTNIEFESSVKEIVNIKELDGKSTQDGTPSPEFPSEIKSVGDDVNLFDINNIKINANMKTDIIDNELIITRIGNGGGYVSFIASNLKIGEKYTIKSNSKIYIYKDKVYGTLYKAIEDASNGYAFIVEQESYVIAIIVGSADIPNIGDKLNCGKIKFQKGTVATSYSKYGEGTLNIEQRGKNKLINSSFRENWTGWWTSNNGTIPIEITEKLGQKCLHITGELQKAKTVAQSIQERVEKGKTYTLSCMAYLKDYVSGTKNPFISFYTDGKTTGGAWTSGCQVLSGHINFLPSFNDYSKGFVKVTATLKVLDNTDLTKALGLYVYARDFTGDLYVYDVQLEESTEATDYEEYFNNTYTLPLSEPLRSLPNGTKDTIEENGIHRRVNTVVFDGTENFYGNNNYYYANITALKNAKNVTFSICSHFTYMAGSSTKVGEFFINNTLGNIAFNYNNSIDNVNGFKTYLAEQYANGTPVICQYELSKEVVEPFTDEQLEVINSMVTENGTNIFELETNAILNYPVNYDTINEEYINDTNVNFGEKYRTY